MASWLIRNGQSKHVRPMLLGDTVVYIAMGALTWMHPPAAIVVFWLPYSMLRFFMMAGNWTEHAFVDIEAPGDKYRNSTNLLNTPYNHRAYNAGYHLIHHIVPGLHWAETVPYFKKHLPMLIERDGIMFDGIRNNQVIFWKLMAHDYGFLADHLLDPANRRPTRDEKIAFLKDRVRLTVGSRKGLVERREFIVPPERKAGKAQAA
jgi:fatty acid desaturase